MEPSHFSRGPPTNSTQPSQPYREIPSPEYVNEMFRYFYLRNGKDIRKASLTDFLVNNTDYKVELYDNDESLRIVLSDACYMSMELEKLRKIRKRLQDAVVEGELSSYWEIDVERNYQTDRGLIEAKFKDEYRRRLEKDEEFRRMEATKTTSMVSAELNLRVNRSLFHW
ncbi:hypothetical protein H9Q69_008553 [Fusarium xylarioides]|nr:hypothetical protein H9Q70_014172 [Fusarium xylarioides]KAG5792396.1 hypothetical protein H9Q69_008553 [Fusarium xylarioides]KAG5805865.1 hypothetical protein H9Q71_009555 [Fusarium xylarioides]KAG5819288.1 hypothetical protein H9Q74_009566 [Fusarium xylarioides]